MVSLPIGAVRLTQTFLHHDPPKKNELEQMRGFIQREVSRIQKRITDAQGADLASPPPARRRRFPVCTPPKSAATTRASRRPCPKTAVANLLKNLSRRNLAQRRALPGIGPRRAEIIIAGTMVFAELMQLCNLRSFRYLPLGLRDGLLAQMMADYNGSAVMRERVEIGAPRCLAVGGQALWRRSAICAAHSRSGDAVVPPLADGASVAAAIRRLAGGGGHAA